MLKKMCRWLGGGIGYLLYTLALLLLLLWLLFPEETFRRLLVQSLNTACPQLRWQVRSMTLQIPEGITLRVIEGYDVWDKEKPLVRVDSLSLRPDLAGTVQSRHLQAKYRLTLANGAIAGVVRMDGWNQKLRVDGSVQGLQLAKCPILARQLERDVRGTLSATFDGRVHSGNISEMDATLSVDQGVLGLRQPILNHAILPFSRASIVLRSRGETMQIEQGVVNSELFNGQFSGEIKVTRDSTARQLDIRGTMLPRPAFFTGVNNASLLKVIRTQLKDRSVPFRISGDLYNPGIHFEDFSLLFESLEKELQ